MRIGVISFSFIKCNNSILKLDFVGIKKTKYLDFETVTRYSASLHPAHFSLSVYWIKILIPLCLFSNLIGQNDFFSDYKHIINNFMKGLR